MRTGALLASVVLGVWPSWIRAQDRTTEVTLRGRALCLDSAHRPSSSCEGDVTFGFETGDGKLYVVSGSDPRRAMLTDPRIRSRRLQIVAWLRPGNEIEIVHLYSIREGRLYDIYYRCDVCDITAYAPGKCWCCQRELELREVPVEVDPSR